MIQAHFTKTGGKLTGFSISGHAGWGDYGEDIVCASVTSAVQLCANALTEVLKIPAEVQVLDNLIKVDLPQPCSQEGSHFLEALLLHLQLLGEDYRGTIKLNVSEV